MNDFDQAARYVAKLEPAEFFRWVLPHLDAALVFRGWGDTRTLPFPGEPDRICDTVAEFAEPATPGRALVVVTEFQSEPRGDMLYRLNEYKARFLREFAVPLEELPLRPVVAVLLNLTGPRQPSGFTMQAPGHPDVGSWLGVRLMTLRDEDAGLTLAAIASGALGRSILPWIPLMRGGEEPAIIEQWKRGATGEPDAGRRLQYAGLALVFADLAECEEAWKLGLEDWDVNESIVVARWRNEGREEGRMEERKEAIRRILELRFPGPLPPDLATVLRAISDLDELSRWLTAAVTAPSLDAFRAAVQSEPART